MRTIWVRVSLVIPAVALGCALALAGHTYAAPSPEKPAAKAAPDAAAEIAALRKELAELKRKQVVELGQQMLGLQIRHARLWYAGQSENWTLAAFQVHELDEALGEVVEENPEHATLQPQRLADVLPSMMNPAVTALRDAVDKRSKADFERAYDNLSASCTGCHKLAGVDFLVIQRPQTPFLDNLRAK